MKYYVKFIKIISIILAIMCFFTLFAKIQIEKIQNQKPQLKIINYFELEDKNNVFVKNLTNTPKNIIVLKKYSDSQEISEISLNKKEEKKIEISTKDNKTLISVDIKTKEEYDSSKIYDIAVYATAIFASCYILNILIYYIIKKKSER